MDFRDRVRQKVKEKSTYVNLALTNDNLSESPPQTDSIQSDYFSIENIRNPTSCLDLRLADGTLKGVPYSHIIEIDFNPSDGIEIQTTGKKISIEGRNLRILYNYLVTFRVKYIQANIGSDLADEKALFVKRISIHEI